MNEIEKRLEKVVNQATEFQRNNQGEEGLKLLAVFAEEIKSLPCGEIEYPMGSIRHHQGRILHSMGKYQSAVAKLDEAIEWRKNDPIQWAYSMFQRFIAKVYGKIFISPEEIIETKKSQYILIDASKSAKQIGDAWQNLGYIEEQFGSIEKTILFYHATECYRKLAKDIRGLALTQARLGECYKKVGKIRKADDYGKKALKYFEEAGDLERIRQVKENVFGESK